MSKIFILGIEGFDFNLVQKWKEDLPNLKNIQDNFVYGKIINDIPKTRATSWINTLTGQNPGIHGFWDDRYRDRKQYNIKNETNINSMKVDNLISILPKNGKVCVFINYPYTNPTPIIHAGICIPELINYGEIDIYIKKLKDNSGLIKLIKKYLKDKKENDSIEKILDAEDKILEMSKLTITMKKNWDCIFLVLSGIRESPEFFFNNSQKYRNNLKKYYSFIDRKISSIYEIIGKDNHLLIYSPTSFFKAEKIFYINNWLIKNGYLLLEEQGNENYEGELNIKNVNWKKTKIWSIGENGYLYINLRGKEKKGSITGFIEYNKLYDSFSRQIKEFFNDIDDSINVEVLRRSGKTYGLMNELGPDIFLEINNPSHLVSSKLITDNKKIFSNNLDRTLLMSSKYGYYALAGPHVKELRGIYDIPLLRITPTIIDILREENYLTKLYKEEQDLVLTETIKDILGYYGNYHMEKSLLEDLKTKDGEKEIKSEDKVTSRLELLGY